jgi:hypothetical protein
MRHDPGKEMESVKTHTEHYELAELSLGNIQHQETDAERTSEWRKLDDS